MATLPNEQQYKLVLEEIWRGPWTQPVFWGYFTGEPQPDAPLHSRSTDPDRAMLFWAEEAVAAVLSLRAKGIPCHLEPPITVRF
jgi:hypothetical protein